MRHARWLGVEREDDDVVTAQIVSTLTELPSIEQVVFGIGPEGAGIRRRDAAEYAP